MDSIAKMLNAIATYMLMLRIYVAIRLSLRSKAQNLLKIINITGTSYYTPHKSDKILSDITVAFNGSWNISMYSRIIPDYIPAYFHVFAKKSCLHACLCVL